MATVKSFKADVSSVSPSSERFNDEGLKLETSAFLLFTAAVKRIAVEIFKAGVPSVSPSSGRNIPSSFVLTKG